MKTIHRCPGIPAGGTDVLEPPTGYVTGEIMDRADAWKDRDESALAAVMRRAEAGGDVTVALIGGSITMGTVSVGSRDDGFPERRPYALFFREWWEKRFPRARIAFVNAGIGGTDSYLGVHRLGEDVLEKNPDVVLVEYSVNDEPTAFFRESYDCLVRHLMSAPSRPAVMLLFMGQTSRVTAKDVHASVGRAYRLPMVSCTDVFNAMMDGGIFSAGDLSGDVVHPSALGHAVTGEILWRFLNGVYARRNADVCPPSPETAGDDKYSGAEILTNASAAPEDAGSFVPGSESEFYRRGWTSPAGGEGIVFRASFRNLGILYLKTVDGLGGKADVLVDGRLVSTLDSDFTGGWGNAITAAEVFAGDACGEHAVTVRPAAGGRKFVLLGLMVSHG